jgi:hypothetical protein
MTCLEKRRAASVLRRSESMKSRGFSAKVGSPKHVRPPAAALDMGLFHTPRSDHFALSAQRIYGNLRRVFYHPSVQGGVINRDVPLGHDLRKISVGNGVTDLERYCMQDHRLWIMHAIEINCHFAQPTYSFLLMSSATTAGGLEAQKLATEPLRPSEIHRIRGEWRVPAALSTCPDTANFRPNSSSLAVAELILFSICSILERQFTWEIHHGRCHLCPARH